MNRRTLLKHLAAIPFFARLRPDLFSLAPASVAPVAAISPEQNALSSLAETVPRPLQRVRPGAPGWPTPMPVAQRIAARDLAIKKRKATAPDTYAPFTIDEYRRMPLDYAFIDQCVQWPARAAHSPHAPLVPDAPYPQVPVLVVSGELDNMTSVADGADAAARFPRAHHVVIANGLHVNALPHSRDECGARLVRRFMADLSSGDDELRGASAPGAAGAAVRPARHRT